MKARVTLVAVALAMASSALAAPDLYDIAVNGISLDDAGDAIPLGFDELLADGRIVLSGTTVPDGVPVTAVEVSLDGGETWQAAKGTRQFAFAFEPSLGETYRPAIRDQSLEATCEASARTGDGVAELSFEAGNKSVRLRLNTTGDVGGHIAIAKGDETLVDRGLTQEVMPQEGWRQATDTVRSSPPLLAHTRDGRHQLHVLLQPPHHGGRADGRARGRELLEPAGGSGRSTHMVGRQAERLTADEPRDSHAIINVQRLHLLKLLVDDLERNELALVQELLEAGTDELREDGVPAGPRRRNVQVDLVVGLGKDQVVQAQQAAVNGCGGLHLERLEDYLAIQPEQPSARPRSIKADCILTWVRSGPVGWLGSASADSSRRLGSGNALRNSVTGSLGCCVVCRT